ncbi:helix-turn-helix domain-containing protein, partial [Pyramidobacter sp. C12-8]|uniref:helix-turn-helix domain-containing protein n=1 Tax=Pyramidobacter sp. C12-8 TaxID=1943580 RepID=UPI0009D10CAB
MSERKAIVPENVLKSDLPMSEKMVLIALLFHADADGECWPSLDTIASVASCSKATVCRALDGLRKKGIIERTRGQNRTVYKIGSLTMRQVEGSEVSSCESGSLTMRLAEDPGSLTMRLADSGSLTMRQVEGSEVSSCESGSLT